MNINKGYFKSNSNFIICLTICLIITSTCMVLINIKSNFKSTTTSTNISTYALVCNNINSINSSINNCVADTSININSASSLLTNAINDLNNCKIPLSGASDNNTALVNDLINSIESTNNLYTYCLNYISTYEETSVDQLVTDLEPLKNACFDSYNKISDYGLSLNYDNNIDKFLYAFVSYYSKLNQLKIETQIKNNQITSFKITMQNICNDFSKLFENLQPAIERIRDENRSFDVLLEDLNYKEESLNSIKKDFNNISIPEGYLSSYNNLNDIFTLYSSYLNSLRTAIIYERSSSSYKNNKEIIDKNYNNAYSKYSNSKEHFSNFLSELENF